MTHEEGQERRGEREPGSEGECTIPVPIPASALNKFVSPQPEHEVRAIREYVESQAPDEIVEHLEKVATEYLPGRRLDAWDVHTTHDRYWVVTNPTNLYSQQTFPSLDYTITFHVGLSVRISARQARSAPPGDRDRLLEAWRRWEQASEELDRADEAEEFQAIGMRCRECLISFVRAVADRAMVPEDRDVPKGADFKGWAVLIAAAIAAGSSAEYVRAHLGAVARTSWDLVNWLTHTTKATRADAEMAINTTQSCLVAFGIALMRWESRAPDRCPTCGSYRIHMEYHPELDIDSPYLALCESCGWLSDEGAADAHES